MPVSDTELEALRERTQVLRNQSAELDAQRARELQERDNDASYLLQLQEQVRLQQEVAAKQAQVDRESAIYTAETADLQEQIRQAAAQLETPPLPTPQVETSDPVPVTETLNLTGVGATGQEDHTGEDN